MKSSLIKLAILLSAIISSSQAIVGDGNIKAPTLAVSTQLDLSQQEYLDFIKDVGNHFNKSSDYSEQVLTTTPYFSQKLKKDVSNHFSTFQPSESECQAVAKKAFDTATAAMVAVDSFKPVDTNQIIKTQNGDIPASVVEGVLILTSSAIHANGVSMNNFGVCNNANYETMEYLEKITKFGTLLLYDF